MKFQLLNTQVSYEFLPLSMLIPVGPQGRFREPAAEGGFGVLVHSRE